MEEAHVTLCFRHHSKRAHLAVANLRQQTVIIGHSWLTLHNTEVDWVSQKVLMTRCPPSCNGRVLPKSDPHHESLPPLRLLDRSTWFTRSFSLQNARNA